jgi:uncharacterized protein YuzE
VRITYNRQANALYLELTDEQLTPSRTTIPTETPADIEAFIAPDWKDDRLVGIEVLDADVTLPPDLLRQAEITD